MPPGHGKRREIKKFTIDTDNGQQIHYGYELVKIKKSAAGGFPGNMDGGYLITKTSLAGDSGADNQAVSAVFVRGKTHGTPASPASTTMHQLIIAVNHKQMGAVCWPRPDAQYPVTPVDGRHRFHAVESGHVQPLEAVPETGFRLDPDPAKAWRAWVYVDVGGGVWKWANAPATVIQPYKPDPNAPTDPTKCQVEVTADTWVAAYFVPLSDSVTP